MSPLCPHQLIYKQAWPRRTSKQSPPTCQSSEDTSLMEKTAEFSTAPRKPRDSRQIVNKNLRVQDQAFHMGSIMEDSRIRTSVSPPKTSHLQQPNPHKVLGSSTSKVRAKVYKKERKEKSE
eukprot:c106_g1_i1 orf=351-713(+)